MLTVIAIAGAAALTVIAYDQLRKNSHDGGTASLKTARDLAAVVLVCVKAVEGIVEVLGGTSRLRPGIQTSSWTPGSEWDTSYDFDQ